MRTVLLVLVVLSFLPACRRHRGRAHSSRPVATDASADAPSNAVPSADAAEPEAGLSDVCRKHEDCAKIELYVEGPLRCCLACGTQAAASKAAADAFLAACTKDKEMRECPIYDCKAAPMDAVCVAGHCMLRPRP